MNNTYHTQNDASELTPTSGTSGREAAPIDPKESASRGKAPGQTEAGIQKEGPGGTVTKEDKNKDATAEEYDNPDGSLDAFD